MLSSLFPERGDKNQVEAGSVFMPRFDSAGVLPAVVSDADSGEVLMLAFMNAEALERTIHSGVAHFWSRSRQCLWAKGETSGNLQRVVELRTDCDQDAVWLRVRVEGKGASCHTGHRSCFYRAVPLTIGDAVTSKLDHVGGEPMFDPKKVYKPTQ